jgi:hypothetical protein
VVDLKRVRRRKQFWRSSRDRREATDRCNRIRGLTLLVNPRERAALFSCASSGLRINLVVCKHGERTCRAER